MEERVIRCAVIGCGVIAPVHTQGIEATEGAELVAVCDILPDRAEKLAQTHGCRYETDVDTLLAQPDIDLVHICVPSGLHAEIGVKAARAGKHVLVEKPIDVSLEAADRLITACREAGVVLSCISQHRFDDAMLAVRRALEEGRFGRLHFGGSHTKWYRSQEYYNSGDWRGTWELDGGGALMNQSVHYVDLLQYVMGPVEEVQAYCATLAHTRIEVEDVAAATLRFRSGALGMLEGNTLAWPGYQTRLDIYGEKGSVIIENDCITAWNFQDGTPAPGEGGMDGGGAASAAIGAVSHQRQIEDVIQAIREGRPPKITGEDARHPLEIILSVYEASRTGKAVKLGTEP